MSTKMNRFLCGQLLWKTLWIMWKSYAFQQVFSGFPSRHPLETPCICRCIIPKNHPFFVLCCHCHRTYFSAVFLEKVGNSTNQGRFSPYLSHFFPNFFVKNQQILRLYDFSGSGYTEFIRLRHFAPSLHSGGTLCRER